MEHRTGRRSLRLQGYDYTLAGAYFVTICTQNRACLFGKITGHTMTLNDAGRMIRATWAEIPVFYQGVDADRFVVMPNHLHGIIVLVGISGLSLPDLVQRFKTMTTKRYGDGVKELGWPPYARRLWQRNYYEHVIRDIEPLDRIRRYIVENPQRWAFDRENPAAQTPESENPWDS